MSSTDPSRIYFLSKARRSAEELVETLTRMIEHDLAITVPDSPEMAAWRELADCRIHTASEYLKSAMEKPALDDVDSGVFCEQMKSVADACKRGQG